MTKSKTSATSAMEVIPASTTSATSTATSNGPTSTPSAVATPVSTTPESKVVASTKSSTMTPTPATILDSKATFNDTISASKESSTSSAKDKKPAPLSSASTDDALHTAKMLAKDTAIIAKGAVPDIKETSSVTDKKSASSQKASAEIIQNYVKPKVVEKVFDLPVVSDTYDSLVKLSSPLSPFVEKIGTMASPVADQALDLKASLEGKIPEVVQTGYTTALNKVVSAAVTLDATLCSGVDNLVDKVPALKQSTPVLYSSTRKSVGSYATLVATYVASFTISQVLLKAADLGLETTDGLLKLTANEKVDPILMGLRRVRDEAISLRKEGVALNGTTKAKTIEEATLFGAMLQIFGLGSFLYQSGNSRDMAVDEGLPEDDDAIDSVAMAPSKTLSGLVL